MGDKPNVTTPHPTETMFERLEGMHGPLDSKDDGIRPVGYTFFRTNCQTDAAFSRFARAVERVQQARTWEWYTTRIVEIEGW